MTDTKSKKKSKKVFSKMALLISIRSIFLYKKQNNTQPKKTPQKPKNQTKKLSTKTQKTLQTYLSRNYQVFWSISSLNLKKWNLTLIFLTWLWLLSQITQLPSIFSTAIPIDFSLAFIRSLKASITIS